MKKIFAISLCVIMIFGLAGCSGKDDGLTGKWNDDSITIGDNGNYHDHTFEFSGKSFTYTAYNYIMYEANQRPIYTPFASYGRNDSNWEVVDTVKGSDLHRLQLHGTYSLTDNQIEFIVSNDSDSNVVVASYSRTENTFTSANYWTFIRE